jgi:hypothetical protein
MVFSEGHGSAVPKNFGRVGIKLEGCSPEQPNSFSLCQTSFCEPIITPTAKTIQQSAAKPIPSAESMTSVGRKFSRASKTPAVK